MVFLQHLVIVIMAMAPVFLSSCSGPATQENNTETASHTSQQTVMIPEFNQDSAYAFVEAQVAFGPRVPNTQAHRDAGDWLEQNLSQWADSVYVQNARLRAFDGTPLNIRNIIGVFQPQLRNRILLCAHWDSRPFADHDPDPANHFTPIDGANDGGSSVGVLLEIARILSNTPPDIGVDIILFDAEDYGQHESAEGYQEDTWALGSQHWARNPHLPDYNARYGILLDMVGNSNATFSHEGFSMMYAPDIVRMVWGTAQKAGYGEYFINREGGFVTDDHYYINKIRNIPTINIIHQDESTPHGFFPQWHTVDDTIEHIDPHTLKAVGQTLLNLLFGNS